MDLTQHLEQTWDNGQISRIEVQSCCRIFPVESGERSVWLGDLKHNHFRKKGFMSFIKAWWFLCILYIYVISISSLFIWKWFGVFHCFSESSKLSCQRSLEGLFAACILDKLTAGSGTPSCRASTKKGFGNFLGYSPYRRWWKSQTTTRDVYMKPCK